MSMPTMIRWSRLLSALTDGGSLPRLSRTLKALRGVGGSPNYTRIGEDIREDPAYVREVHRVVLKEIVRTRLGSLDAEVNRPDGSSSARIDQLVSEAMRDDARCEDARIDLSAARKKLADALTRHATTKGYVSDGQALMLHFAAFYLSYQENPEVIRSYPAEHPALASTWIRGPHEGTEFRYDIFARWLASRERIPFKITTMNVSKLKERLLNYMTSQRDLQALNNVCYHERKAYEDCTRPYRSEDPQQPPQARRRSWVCGVEL